MTSDGDTKRQEAEKISTQNKNKKAEKEGYINSTFLSSLFPQQSSKEAIEKLQGLLPCGGNECAVRSYEEHTTKESSKHQR